MTPEYLFVYGTLRSGAQSEMARLLARSADLIGLATFQGRLYRVDYYPAVVPSRHSGDQVKGEVYRLRDPDAVLPALDDYEGCGPGYPEPAEYIRRKEQVRLKGGETFEAWIYLYNLPGERLPRIESGDFME